MPPAEEFTLLTVYPAGLTNAIVEDFRNERMKSASAKTAITTSGSGGGSYGYSDNRIGIGAFTRVLSALENISPKADLALLEKSLLGENDREGAVDVVFESEQDNLYAEPCVALCVMWKSIVRAISVLERDTGTVDVVGMRVLREVRETINGRATDSLRTLLAVAREGASDINNSNNSNKSKNLSGVGYLRALYVCVHPVLYAAAQLRTTAAAVATSEASASTVAAVTAATAEDEDDEDGGDKSGIGISGIFGPLSYDGVGVGDTSEVEVMVLARQCAAEVEKGALVLHPLLCQEIRVLACK